MHHGLRPLRTKRVAKTSPLSLLARRENVNILFTRAQEVEEIQSSVFARFTNTQQYQILPQAFFRSHTFDNVSKHGKRLYRMLGIVVIPWNSIILQESKQVISVFLKTLSDFDRHLSLQIPMQEFFVEAIHGWKMLFQKMVFQPKAVYRFNHWS